MDLLNNIWTAVSTPNEGMSNAIFVIFNFIEMYVSMQFFIVLLKISATKNQKLTYTAITGIITLLTKLLIPSPSRVLVNYIIMFACIKKIFDLTTTKSVIAFIAQSAIGAIVTSLTLKPFITLANISSQDMENIPIYKALFLLICYTIILFITLALKHNKINLTLLDNFDKKTKSIIVLTLLFGLFFIIAQAFSIYVYTDKIPILFSILNFLLFLSYFIISMYALNKITKLTDTTQKLESAEEYNKTLHILHDSVRGFKHDFDNIVASIGGYINTNDMEGLKKYYTQLEDNCERVNNLYVFNPDTINNPGIYNLLTSKYYKAEQNNVKFNLTTTLDLTTLKMQIFDFARILGILLDNAIEASSECIDKKEIHVIFRNDPKNNRQLIIVENTYKNKDINIDEIFKKGVSGKEKHSGLGLWEVQEILKKNNNLNIHTTKNDNFFTQQLEIYYKPSNNSLISTLKEPSKKNESKISK